MSCEGTYRHRSIVTTLASLDDVLNRWSASGWEISQVAVISQTDIIVLARRQV